MARSSPQYTPTRSPSAFVRHAAPRVHELAPPTACALSARARRAPLAAPCASRAARSRSPPRQAPGARRTRTPCPARALCSSRTYSAGQPCDARHRRPQRHRAMAAMPSKPTAGASAHRCSVIAISFSSASIALGVTRPTRASGASAPRAKSNASNAVWLCTPRGRPSVRVGAPASGAGDARGRGPRTCTAARVAGAWMNCAMTREACESTSAWMAPSTRAGPPTCTRRHPSLPGTPPLPPWRQATRRGAVAPTESWPSRATPRSRAPPRRGRARSTAGSRRRRAACPRPRAQRSGCRRASRTRRASR